MGLPFSYVTNWKPAVGFMGEYFYDCEPLTHRFYERMFMKMLNRSALRLRARPAFLEWCASVTPAGAEELAVLKAQLEQTGTVYLIDEVESEQDFMDAVVNDAMTILTNELSAWCVDTALWPQELTPELLENWFAIGTELMCFDLSTQSLLVADPEALGGDGEIIEDF